MAKHRAGRGADRWILLGIGVLAGLGLIVGVGLTRIDGSPQRAGNAAELGCDRPVRVVTASSFAPVLQAMAGELAKGDNCVRLDVTAADGRSGIKRAAELAADVWVPDDAAWVGSAGTLSIAQPPMAGAGTVLATSPFYMVTDKQTGAKLTGAGGGWLGMTKLVADDKNVHLVIRDPVGSGDGMMAAGGPAEAVWQDVDMDASALWLSHAQHKTRIVTTGAALPAQAGEVGVVPEYALNAAIKSGAAASVALPGTDHTVMLRYTWYPLTPALADPARAAALERLRVKLTGAAGAAAIKNAGLRTPGDAQAAVGTLPAPKAKPFEVLGPHNVDHVFATWYLEDRRTDLLVAVDVSGSMAGPTPGSSASRIELVRQGSRSLVGLLPDDARMGMWEFGSEIDGSRDYRQLLGVAALTGTQRQRLRSAIDGLAPEATGTGLYDTILAAYTSARNGYRQGVPNQVLIFTDGKNESDENSLTAGELAGKLKAAADPKRPILLSVVTFGAPADAKVVEDALKPVDGYVDRLDTADEVAAVFFHVAAGGLQH
jgi:hypothetical protein